MAYVCYDCQIIFPSGRVNCPSCGGRIYLDEKTDSALQNEGFTLFNMKGKPNNTNTQSANGFHIVPANGFHIVLPDILPLIERIKTEGGPKKAVCANCGKDYISGDKYCRFCGAPMGSPSFIPERFAEIYGPRPIMRVHTCADCGFSWETMQMVDDARWCPRCGGTAPAVKVDIRRRTAPAIDALEEDESGEICS